MIAYDAYKTALAKGDFIIYMVKKSTSVEMHVAQITDITERNGKPVLCVKSTKKEYFVDGKWISGGIYKAYNTQVYAMHNVMRITRESIPLSVYFLLNPITYNEGDKPFTTMLDKIVYKKFETTL